MYYRVFSPWDVKPNNLKLLVTNSALHFTNFYTPVIYKAQSNKKLLFSSFFKLIKVIILSLYLYTTFSSNLNPYIPNCVLPINAAAQS